MENALYWLLGVEPKDWAEGGQWSVRWLGMPRGGDTVFLILLGVAAAMVLFWWLYRREGGVMKQRTRYLLVALRITILASVIVMLLEPALVLRRVEQKPSELLILVDTSFSMGLSDAWTSPQEAKDVAKLTGLDSPAKLTKITRIELTKRLLESGWLDKLSNNGERKLHLHVFDERLGGSELSLDDKSKKLKLGGRSTAIGEAIQQVLLGYQGKDIAGVVLLSDGQNTTPNSLSTRAAADAARAAGVQVFPLAIGTATGPQNAAVDKLEGNDVMFINDVDQLTAVVTARGLKDRPATLVLERLSGQAENPGEDDWVEVQSKEIELGEDATPKRFSFELRPAQRETVIYRARVVEVPGEIDKDDNVAQKQVNVIYDKTRVLFIAGYTFPEVQFLRNALIRDETVEVSTWLQTADPDYKHPGNRPIARLPEDLTELAGGTKNGRIEPGYDCIVLYDPTPEKWPPGFSEMLSKFVTERGGGLVYIAGERYTEAMFKRKGDPAVSYMDLMPVVRQSRIVKLEDELELTRKEPWKLVVTDAGMRDPVFAFTMNTTTNKKVLEQLPGLMWHMPVTREKPGATVLARHGHPAMTVTIGDRQEQQVLMATHLVGPGRVLWIGFDSTYRWRFAGEQVFDGFWARVVDRAGLMKQLGGQHPYRVNTDKESYEPGEEVTLTAEFTSAGQVDAGMSQLYAQVLTGDNEPIEVVLAKTGELSFQATFTAERAGDYLVRVWPGNTPAQLKAKPNIHGFNVAVPDFETRNPVLGSDALSSMAATTNGAYFKLAEADKLPDALTIGLVDHELIHSDEVWNAPLLIFIFLFAIIGEWVIRKRCRLV